MLYFRRLIIVFLLVSSSFATAKEYVIGVEDISYYPLYDFKNAKTSFTKELFDEFGRQYGHQFTYLPLPIKRFSRWLIEHQIDFKYPDNIRWNPDGRIFESFVYSDRTIRLIAGTLTPTTKKITDKSQIKVMGTLLGFYPTQWINEIEEGSVELYENSSTMSLIQQVLRGHVDGIDLEPSVVNYHLKKLKKPGALEVNRNLTYEVYDYYLSTIKHKDVILQFNEFLANNKSFIDDLRNKFEIVDYRPYLKHKKSR